MIRFRRSRLKLRILLSRVTRQPRDVLLHHEFNLWAEEKRGESMEDTHRHMTEEALAKMDLSSADRILELACGEGWACRTMAGLMGENAPVVGLDISDHMVRRALAKNRQFKHLSFICGSAEHIPCADNFFTKILCVESFMFFENQERALSELLRVMAPNGRLFLLHCLYRDYPKGFASVEKLHVPVHVRSAAEYKAMLQSAGWADVQTEEFVRKPDPDRKPNVHDRALFISARKPALGDQMARFPMVGDLASPSLPN